MAEFGSVSVFGNLSVANDVNVKGDRASFIYAGATEPNDPTAHAAWLDTSSTPYLLKYHDGSTWQAINTYA